MERSPDYLDQFSGAINLANPLGTYYKTHDQAGALTLAAANPTRGGCAQVIIVSDGSVINVPAGWVKYAGDDISVVVGDENHLFVLYVDNDVVYYSNKVVTP